MRHDAFRGHEKFPRSYRRQSHLLRCVNLRNRHYSEPFRALGLSLVPDGTGRNHRLCGIKSSASTPAARHDASVTVWSQFLNWIFLMNAVSSNADFPGSYLGPY
jgi:hypothetical protein